MKKKEIIITIIIIVVCAAVYFGVRFFLDKDLEDQISQIAVVEHENVATSVAKFNTQILDSGMEVPVYQDSVTIQNDTYYFPLYEDVVFYVKPVNYTGNQEEDISSDVGIFYDADSKNEGLGKEYLKRLIKANKDTLTDEEIANLMSEAQTAAQEDKAVDKNIGIVLRYFAGDNGFNEFLIARKYKEDIIPKE